MKKLLYVAALLLASISVQAATVLWDESSNGDLIDRGSTFNVVNGKNMIYGTAYVGDADRFYLHAAPGQTIMTFYISTPGCDDAGYTNSFCGRLDGHLTGEDLDSPMSSGLGVVSSGRGIQTSYGFIGPITTSAVGAAAGSSSFS